MLDVTGFVSNTDVGDSVSSVAIVSGGRGYATPPSITLQGGGGTGGVVNCTIDQYGAITTVTVVSGGRGYNRGGGASGYLPGLHSRVALSFPLRIGQHFNNLSVT